MRNKKHIYDENTIQWFLLNYPKYGGRYCSDYMKVSMKEIRYLTVKYAVTNEKYKSNIDETIKQFLIENFEKIGTKKCAEQLKIPMNKVTIFAKKLKLKCTKQTVCKLSKMSKINNRGVKVPVENFKNIDDFKKAYVCGIIYADGSIGANRVSVTASKSDMMDIIQLFMETGEWKIIDNIYKNRSTKPLLTLNAYNTDLQKLFKIYGYDRKSIGPHTEILNNIPKDLHYAFWRGLFDGDGHCGNHSASISASFNFNWMELEKLCQKLEINFIIQKNINKKNNNKSSTFLIRNKYNIFKLYNYLYPNEYYFGFKRKHNQFIKCLTYSGKNKIGNRIKFKEYNNSSLKYI
jgi:hypothetical protein